MIGELLSVIIDSLAGNDGGIALGEGVWKLRERSGQLDSQGVIINSPQPGN